MSQQNDISDHEINRKKRSRWNEDDVDEGEIQENESSINQTAISSKRLRPTAAVIESNDNNNNQFKILETSSDRSRGKQLTSNDYNKKSREELERERQIRMAALRDETEKEDTSSSTSIRKHHTTQQDSSTSTTTNNHSKIKMRSLKRKFVDSAIDEETIHADGNDDTEAAADDDDANESESEDDSAKQMKALFGISDFGSTKNTKVLTNHTSAAIGTIAKHLKPRKYRQYMNRKNGFNRPLDNA